MMLVLLTERLDRLLVALSKAHLAAEPPPAPAPAQASLGCDIPAILQPFVTDEDAVHSDICRLRCEFAADICQISQMKRAVSDLYTYFTA